MISAEQLVDLISSRVDLRPAGRAWGGRCPFGTHEDKHPSFYVFADRDDGHGRFKCHGCGWCGNEISWRRFVGETVAARPDPELQKQRRRARERDTRIQAFHNRNPDSVIPDWGIQ